MGKTKHFKGRMSQRAITQDLVDLTLRFGFMHDDGKVVLNRKALSSLMDQLRSLQRSAQKAMEKGGIVVVAENGSLITTYRLESYNCTAALSAND